MKKNKATVSHVSQGSTTLKDAIKVVLDNRKNKEKKVETPRERGITINTSEVRDE